MDPQRRESDVMNREECYVSQAVIEDLRKIIEDSDVLKGDDRHWPAPDRSSRQELEVVCGMQHIAFATSKLGSLSDVQASKDPEGLGVFYHLVLDLNCFVSGVIELNSHHTTLWSGKP